MKFWEKNITKTIKNIPNIALWVRGIFEPKSCMISLLSIFRAVVFPQQILIRDQGWQWGKVGPKDGVFVPVPHSFVLRHPRPALHDGENFLTPSPPLGALQSPASSRKTLLFVNLPYNQYNFFNISLIKIYLKLQLNLSHEIKSIFRKKLNNIFKCLTRQSIYIKKKN